jgi:hypothetical protein
MISKFQAGNRAMGRKGATYQCHVCKRQTRETGHEESSLQLCAYCLLEAYLENELSDGVIEQPEFEQKLDELQKEYKRGKYGKTEADQKVRKVQSSKYVAKAAPEWPVLGKGVEGNKLAVRVGPGLAQVLSLDDSQMCKEMELEVRFAKTFLEIIGTRKALKELLDTCNYRCSGAFDQPLWYTNSAAQAAKKIAVALEAK